MSLNNNDFSSTQKSKRNDGMPTIPPQGGALRPDLPRRVDELDMNATNVTPAAYKIKTQPHNGNNARRAWGCFVRGLIILVFILVALGLLFGAYGIYKYYQIASALPSIEDLSAHAAQFETTRILDRDGNVLYELLDPNAGRRTHVPLKNISPYLIAATIATEDKEFYQHPGFDPVAITRALWQNYTTGGISSGASTITQQLARALLLSPEERIDRSYTRKAREIILAAELTRRYSKEEILELYLNEIYYGNLAYGIEAASETYFHTTADKLTLSQAAFLAGLPQSPAVYDVYNNREETLGRQKTVLVLMYQVTQDQNCIYVSTSTARICVDASAAALAADEMDKYTFPTPDINMRYPHWVNYIRAQLESQFDAQTIYRSGFTIYTTLDPKMQDIAQTIVSQQVANLVQNNATDGALVAIKPSTGEILSMVGSADFYNDAIAGQVNMAVSPTRQPGSSIKPFTYLAAFEKGWTASTLIWDVRSNFPPSGLATDTREPYEPVNYDGRFHGPVTVRTALSNSYNIPAVKTLAFTGIYDDPSTPAAEGLIGMAKKLGITTLAGDQYGLALTLGGGEVSLLEMTGAFAVIANQGKRMPPYSISKIVDHEGNVIFEYQPAQAEQVIRVEHAYLISSILSDNEARAPMFGTQSVLAMPFPAAAKTGTTNDFRDNWTMGYTPDLAVGVWIGNADYTPMVNTTGLTGAAPIWAQFMQSVIPEITNNNPSSFTRPASIVEKVICAISGALPSEYCRDQRIEIFAADQLPVPAEEDLWKKLNIDTWTGLNASSACNGFSEDKVTLNIKDEFAKEWIRTNNDGERWANKNGFDKPVTFTPTRDCRASDPRPTLGLFNLQNNQTINTTELEIRAVADATQGFRSFRLEYGEGRKPVRWTVLYSSDQPVRNPENIFIWNLKNIPNGIITLRLYMDGAAERYAEVRFVLNIEILAPTAIPSTDTPVPTETQEPTSTPEALTDTPEPTNTPIPTDTPFPTETPTP